MACLASCGGCGTLSRANSILRRLSGTSSKISLMAGLCREDRAVRRLSDPARNHSFSSSLPSSVFLTPCTSSFSCSLSVNSVSKLRLLLPVEGRTIKAATFSATKWDWVRELGRGAGPDGEDVTFLRTSVGRHREEATLQRPDEQLLAAALGDLRAVLGRALPPPVDAHVQRWGGALPQYAVGHVELVAQVRAAVAQVPGIAVCGATYDGVGVPACIASARRAVAELHPAQ